jgi:predicted nucleotidyltransferase
MNTKANPLQLTRNSNDINVQLIELVAQRLGAELCEQFVFVGGAVAGLLITDPAMPAIRPTQDVDIVAQIVALPDYHRLEKTLRAKGFAQDMRKQAPICRWLIDDLMVDIMPSEKNVLGFANRWYPLAVQHPIWMQLSTNDIIRVISAPFFIGTKLEAFAGRGQGDYLFSHDMGDIISIVDGRESLVSECRSAPLELQMYLSGQFDELMKTEAFTDALPGHLPSDAASQQRLPELKGKLKALAELAITNL